MGTLTFGAGGWAFTLVLLAFFIPSVALSRVGRARKKRLTDIGKGGARDGWQVLANGGVATACAVIAASRFDAPRTDTAGSSNVNANVACETNGQFQASSRSLLSAQRWLAAFAGAYAAATADTWGTEIGTLVPGTPHSILTFAPIPTGLSGGVTFAGTAAEVAGAIWIALSSAPLFDSGDVPKKLRENQLISDDLANRKSPHAEQPSAEKSLEANVSRNRITLAICIGGILGALIDSVLGATVQELRRCPLCERTCETNPHDCGAQTTLVRGIAGFSNDMVNAAATLTGAAAAFALSR